MGNLNELEIIETGDGSKSLFLPSLNETYHSVHGALAESRHVFIKSGLEYLCEKQTNITLLEVGMGTGLNVMLSLEFAINNPHISINYHTLEAHPINWQKAAQLNYHHHIAIPNSKILFETLHRSKEITQKSLLNNFVFNKYHIKLQDFTGGPFDLVYYDAFAPNKQADMWETKTFEHLIKSLKPNAHLVTYCSQGKFKRLLKSLEFTLEELPGPPGKREMTRAFLT